MYLNKVVKHIVILILIFNFSCDKSKESLKINKEVVYLNYSKNILDYRITPKDSIDKSGLMFSDQGAWFAYGFPDSISSYGGFSGPFLMTQQNGIWSSPSLAKLQLNNVEWKAIETESFNSHLEQTFKSENIELEQELVFSSGHTAIIRSTITNKSNSNIKIEYQWGNQGLLTKNLTLSSTKNKLKITSSKSTATGYLLFPNETVISSSKTTYTTVPTTLELKPNEFKEIVVSQTFIFPEYSWEQEEKQVLKSNFELVLKARKLEKEEQLAHLISNQKKQFVAKKYSEALAKSILTLQNNWRIPAGELKFEGLFPSYHYKWFNGFWSWDSWKHSVGLSYFNIELAKNQIRAMFDFQSEDGFVVDCIYRDTNIEPHNYRDTKPPLSAWAVVKIFEKDNNLKFVKELYPKLKKYHYWWYNKRDHDKDGLCEYGSTDGTLIAAKWESGMDNAIRFDDSIILKNEEGAYSLNQESVDLNAYLYAEKLYLAQLAEAIQENKDVEVYKIEAKTLKIKIQTQFYDSVNGWFYDTNLEGNKFIKGEGSEGWIPLWANVVSKKQAETVKNLIMDPKKFFTKVPFQTMSADHPKFNPLKGYWRGPNWLDQAYFGVKGLRNYNFNTEADLATVKILEGAEGILGKGKSIRENYHPITGEGLNAQNFSWSAAHIIMLLTD